MSHLHSAAAVSEEGSLSFSFDQQLQLGVELSVVLQVGGDQVGVLLDQDSEGALAPVLLGGQVALRLLGKMFSMSAFLSLAATLDSIAVTKSRLCMLQLTRSASL